MTGPAGPAPTAVGSRFLAGLPAAGRERLLAHGRPVTFPAGARLFEEGRRADRFWVIRSGTVALDLHVPGRRAMVVETLPPGELLGWSWLFPPYAWQLGGAALGPVTAVEFDATAVRALCERDAALGHAVCRQVAETIARRLRSSRRRLLDVYGPYGSGAG
ncbi:cyclic nucleotide-binding domain-containing protein [Streptomyces sp. DSM 44917]|uniref:Cyclic nucleotide-binding domain-containing protein n=1 Tax=Streptomyces boetiae TaxID=3075541 RepID=A0ABU2LDW7_9ACTN|nr:cyclic nucleotide-binding domain-containing protein [Streptomyces sp. DSM 44917]MDT0309784.1 cyclic nucleotide-binding domain-containing protein [Streptomyces sp. DSM 44917]